MASPDACETIEEHSNITTAHSDHDAVHFPGRSTRCSAAELNTGDAGVTRSARAVLLPAVFATIEARKPL